MSIATEITRLQQAKTDLATAITDKGVTVPSGTTLDGYADLVGAISTGASNCVCGTFNSDTEGVHTIDLGYTGNGYPISVSIFPASGHSDDAGMRSLVFQGAVIFYFIVKGNCNTAPTYSDAVSANKYWRYVVYKSSTSNTTSSSTLSYTSVGDAFAVSGDPSYGTNCIRMNSASTLKVYITNTENHTGFVAGYTYRYVVAYSE